MKKRFIAAALACALLSTAAMSQTLPGGFLGGSGGEPGLTNSAGGGGGGGGGALGIVNPTIITGSSANLTSQVGIATTVGLGVTTGSTSASGVGLGGSGSATGGTGGTATASVGAGAGAVTINEAKAASAPAFAPAAHGPLASCRIFVGLGGTNTSGSLSGGIPIGNDQVCVVDASHKMMDRLNGLKPGSFKYVDYLRPVCKFEGMSDTPECKTLTVTASEPVNAGPTNAYAR